MERVFNGGYIPAYDEATCEAVYKLYLHRSRLGGNICSYYRSFPRGYSQYPYRPLMVHAYLFAQGFAGISDDMCQGYLLTRNIFLNYPSLALQAIPLLS